MSIDYFFSKVDQAVNDIFETYAEDGLIVKYYSKEHLYSDLNSTEEPYYSFRTTIPKCYEAVQKEIEKIFWGCTNKVSLMNSKLNFNDFGLSFGFKGLSINLVSSLPMIGLRIYSLKDMKFDSKSFSDRIIYQKIKENYGCSL